MAQPPSQTEKLVNVLITIRILNYTVLSILNCRNLPKEQTEFLSYRCTYRKSHEKPVLTFFSEVLCYLMILWLTHTLKQTKKLQFIGSKTWRICVLLMTVNKEEMNLYSLRYRGHTHNFACFYIPIWFLLCTSHFHSLWSQKKKKRFR